ncbi:hypothetical protein B6U66_02630 [Candidatus Bathyarchaeota archaeon ex4484_135]|nr:MAG: hypothetical protein B6U66_02630 [Candidatus Bathyarchaeota archaeon ex4484_135]
MSRDGEGARGSGAHGERFYPSSGLFTMGMEKEMPERPVFPFSAIVGLEKLKLALLLNAVDPRIGGVLIKGPKGSGKTTCVRAFADVLPTIKVVKGCPFNCNPYDLTNMCEKCRERYLRGEELPVEERKMKVVNLPLSATEDRVVGSLDVEKAIKHGIEALKPGILAEANQNILYVDEVNLLPDHLADDLLDAAATGWNVVEREGISVSHPSRFILVGSMNPEEGELRPQLLDRFGLSVVVDNITSVEERMEIVRRSMEFEDDPEGFLKKYEAEQKKLRQNIIRARELLPRVQIPEELLKVISEACVRLGVDGMRPDIVMARAARALAALRGKTEVELEDVLEVAELALGHRTREHGRKEPARPEEIRETILDVASELGLLRPGGEEAGRRRGLGFFRRRARKGPPGEGPGVSVREAQPGSQEGLRVSSGGPALKDAKPSSKFRGIFKKIGSFFRGLCSCGLMYRAWEPPKRIDVGIEARKIDRILREVCGKRVKSLMEGRRGRRWSWRFPRESPRAIHIPATIRAAVRRKPKAPIEIRLEDIMEPLYVCKAPATIMFILDASDSMHLTYHLVRRTVSCLYHDFRIHRDKVG